MYFLYLSNMEIAKFTMVVIVLYNLISCCVPSEVDSQLLSANVDKGLLYGYQIGDITQGIGYGHYLHPFYYQGASKKYYKCAVEDEWKPLSGYRTPVSSDDQHLQKPQKNISPVKKYQHIEETLKKKLAYSKKDFITPVHRKKYGNSVTRKHYRMQNRNDYDIFEGEQRLQQDHAKLVRDINDLSEDQPFLKRFSEQGQILTLDSENDSNINVAESAGKEYMTHDESLTDTYQGSGYKVHENTMDVPPMLSKAPPQQKFNHPQSKIPFQKYKKFRIITVKPQSVIHLKYSGSPNKNKPPKEVMEPVHSLAVRPQYSLQESIPESHHYSFVSTTKQNDVTKIHRYHQRPHYEMSLKPVAFRQGRNYSPAGIPRHPRLTVLEQFLLLFPKLIR